MAQLLNEQFIRMQKLAGVITEGEYKMKIQEADEQQLEKVADTIVKKAEETADDPEKAKQILAAVKAQGIDMNLVKQAAAQLKQGKDPKDVLVAVSKEVPSDVAEGDNESVKTAKTKRLLQNMGLGFLVGGAGGFMGAVGIGASIVLSGGIAPAILFAAGLLAGGALGAGVGAATTNRDATGGNIPDYVLIQNAEDDFSKEQDKAYKETGRYRKTPKRDQIYIVDNGATPEELKGKDLWRRSYDNRDVLIDLSNIPITTDRRFVLSPELEKEKEELARLRDRAHRGLHFEKDVE